LKQGSNDYRGVVNLPVANQNWGFTLIFTRSNTISYGFASGSFTLFWNWNYYELIYDTSANICNQNCGSPVSSYTSNPGLSNINPAPATQNPYLFLSSLVPNNFFVAAGPYYPSATFCTTSCFNGTSNIKISAYPFNYHLQMTIASNLITSVFSVLNLYVI